MRRTDIERRRASRIAAAALTFGLAGCGHDTNQGASGGTGGGSGAPSDSCGGVDCSGHGVCAVGPDGPICVCDPGYRPEDLSCKAIEPGQECDGVDCSGHGQCVVVSGDPDYPSCICDAGYTVFNGVECVPVPPSSDPCEGQACSGHGTCVLDEQDNPVCDCEEGYLSVGLTCPPEGAVPDTCTCTVGDEVSVATDGLPGYGNGDEVTVMGIDTRADGPGFAFLLRHSNLMMVDPVGWYLLTWDPKSPNDVTNPMVLDIDPEYGVEVHLARLGDGYVLVMERANTTPHEFEVHMVDPDGTVHTAADLGGSVAAVFVLEGTRVLVGRFRVEGAEDPENEVCGTGALEMQEYDTSLQPVGSPVPLGMVERRWAGSVNGYLCRGSITIRSAALDDQGKAMVYVGGEGATWVNGEYLMLPYRRFVRETDTQWLQGPAVSGDPCTMLASWPQGFFCAAESGSVGKNAAVASFVDGLGAIGPFYALDESDRPAGVNRIEGSRHPFLWEECTMLGALGHTSTQRTLLKTNPLESSYEFIEALEPSAAKLRGDRAVLRDEAGEVWWIWGTKDAVFARAVSCSP